MRSLIDPEGPVLQFITKIVYSVWLNLLWFICCIPIFTIGPATTALFYTCQKIARDEEGYVTKGDNNPTEDPGTVSPDQVVGKVISCIPYVGYLVLFLHRPYTHLSLLMIAAVSAVVDFLRKYVTK